jgi:beta-lactamase regulating signal transducer with metallopeptidase domain
MAAIRHVIRWARLQRVLVRSGLPSESVRAQVEQMAQVLGVAAPRVLVSHQTAAPFVVGALRPALVWPSALLESLSPPEQQLVVQHELSHLARGDHRLAPLLSLLQLAFPFHPTAKRLMRELAVAREEAVDARIDHEQLHVYAQLLVTVTAHANLKPRQLEVLGMADTSLQRRIAALTHAAPRPLARFGRVAVLGVAMISALVFAPQAIAQTSGHVLSLAVGEAKTLRVPNARRVAVGDPTVCDIESLPDGGLRVVGVAPGSTTVLVWAGAEGQQTTYMCSVAQKK